MESQNSKTLSIQEVTLEELLTINGGEDGDFAHLYGVALGIAVQVVWAVSCPGSYLAYRIQKHLS